MRKAVKILFIAIVVMAVTLSAASAYFLNYALAQDKTYDFDDEIATLKENYPWLSEWADSIVANNALLDTTITNGKNQRIHAYYLPAKQDTKNTVVLIHGYKDCAAMMLRYGYIYNTSLNYNVFLPDLHAHGISEGSYIQMGWLDRLDVIRWISVADETFGGKNNIVVHGLSMGAATTMMTSGEESVPECVKCYIEDCGYSSVYDEFKAQLKDQFGLPAFPLLDVTSWACDIRYGWNFREADALSQVAKCKRPMLFIHGDDDTFVPTRMVYPLHDAHHGPKSLWIAKGSAHAKAYHDHPEEYTHQVKTFLQKYNK